MTDNAKYDRHAPRPEKRTRARGRNDRVDTGVTTGRFNTRAELLEHVWLHYFKDGLPPTQLAIKVGLSLTSLKTILAREIGKDAYIEKSLAKAQGATPSNA